MRVIYIYSYTHKKHYHQIESVFSTKSMLKGNCGRHGILTASLMFAVLSRYHLGLSQTPLNVQALHCGEHHYARKQ